MERAQQQTYYFDGGFRSVPKDGNPLEISREQFRNAVDILETIGSYVPSRENPEGSKYNDREFLADDCLARVNPLSQLHEGKNTRVIRLFTKRGYMQDLDLLAEKLGLPFSKY